MASLGHFSRLLVSSQIASWEELSSGAHLQIAAITSTRRTVTTATPRKPTTTTTMRRATSRTSLFKRSRRALSLTPTLY
jgi:hypothetical protein